MSRKTRSNDVRDSRKARRFRPDGIATLEDRTLLTITPTWVGTANDQDYVGPDAGVGSDGIYDDEIDLTGNQLDQSALIETVKILHYLQGSSSSDETFYYNNVNVATNGNGARGNVYSSSNVNGYNNIAVKQASPSSSAQLFVSPYSYQYNSNSQYIGSESLSTGDTLQIQITYADKTTATTSVTVGSSATISIPAATIGSDLGSATTSLSGITESNWSQNSQTASQYPGWVEFQISGVNGTSITGASLSDNDGNIYEYGSLDNSSLYSETIDNPVNQNIAILSSSPSGATIAFSPLRNENPPSQPGQNTAPAQMLLRLSLNNGTTTQGLAFQGGSCNPAWTVAGVTSTTTFTMPPSNDPNDGTDGDSAELESLLNSTNPVYGTIDFEPGATYYFHNFITINRPVVLTSAGSASNNNLPIFQFGSTTTNAWIGAFVVDSSNVTLSNLDVTFNPSDPVFWNTSLSLNPAVINTTNASSYPIYGDTFSGLTISGPSFYYQNPNYVQSSFDHSGNTSDAGLIVPSSTSTNNLPVLLQQNNYKVVLEHVALNAFTSTNVVDGTISNNIITGGTTQIGTGPWTINDNNFQGAIGGTITDYVISDNGDVDLNFTNNIVHQVDPLGRTYSLLSYGQTLTHSYNTYLYNNDIYGNVGQYTFDIGVSYNGNNSWSQGDEPSDVWEFLILAEDYRFDYEGKPLYVSGSFDSPQVSNPSQLTTGSTGASATDGREILIPPPQGEAVASGDIVSVLSGRDPNHSSDPGAAPDGTGDWSMVEQVLAINPDGTELLLLSQPLPADPEPQYGYAINIHPSFVNTTIQLNTFNVSQSYTDSIAYTSVTGLNINTNTFIGGDLQRRNGNTDLDEGGAISVQAAGYNNSVYLTQNAPAGYTFNPSFGINISNNIIQDTLQGVVLSAAYVSLPTGGVPIQGYPTSNAQPRRTYIYGSVENNSFEYSSDLPAQQNSEWTDHINSSTYPEPTQEPYASSVAETGAYSYGSDPLLKPMVIGSTQSNFSAEDGIPDIDDQNFYQNLPFYLGEPWLVGGPNGSVDPKSIVASVTGNTYLVINGTSNTSIDPTSVLVAGIINGITYNQNNTPVFNTSLVTVPSSPPVDQPIQVNLGSYYQAVGITTAGSGTEGGADSGHDSLSSSALGSTVAWGNQTFALGPANANDIVPATGQPISIPQGSYTSLFILAMSTGYGEEMGGVYRIDYTNGSYDQYTLGISDWMYGYTGTGGTTGPGESKVETMQSYDTWNGTQDVSTSGTTYVYGLIIPVDPSRTIQDISLPNNGNIKILAINVVDQPIQVNLGSYYQAVGITTAGSGTEGGADSGHDSLSSSALGSTVAWGNQTFALGPANANDIVPATGQPISIPQGSYTSLFILAMSTGYGEEMGGVYRIDYTNGSYDQYTLGISDWMYGYTGTGGTTGPGESKVETMQSYDTWNGTQDVSTSGTTYVYGLIIPVDPSRTIQDISLPNNGNIKILAINVVDQPIQVNLGSAFDHTSSNNTQIPFNGIGISEDDAYQQASINSTNISLSNAALGNAANWASGTANVWDGQTFTLGPASFNDVVLVGGQSIPVTQGTYTNLMVLASSVRGFQDATFTVYYTDGSSSTFNQTISDIVGGYTGTGGTTAPGESIAVTMPYYNNSSSGRINANAYLYGYNFTLNPTKTVASISLNNNANMAIFAMDLLNQSIQVNLGSAFDHTSSNNTQIPFNGIGISEDDAYQQASINSTNISLSNAALGNAANWASGTANVWDGQTFTLGPASFNDVVLVGGQSIPVTQGTYTNLMVLASSVRGFQDATFTVYYTDGSSSTFNQTISDIVGGYTGTGGTTAPGESIAVTMPYYNNSSSGRINANAYLYGYNFTLNPTKTVASISLNNNANMAIFAMDLISQTQRQSSDDFDRPNASSLGSNWVQPVGSIEISGNQAMGTGSSPVNDAFYAAGGLLSDTDVSANVSVTASGQFAELVARYSGPGDTNLYEGGIIDSGGTITAVVFRNVGGTWTQLASSAVSTGTGLLEFQVVGSSLRLWFNGVLVCSTTDTQITAAGLSGIRGSANVTWNTFNLIALASDDFDRPNASSLGSNWVQPVGSIEISGNQAMGTGSSPVNDAFYAAGGLLSDTDVSANVSVTASGQFAELVARYSGPGDTNLYEGGIIDSGGTITAVVFRNVGGTWTQLASSAVSTGTGLLEFQVVGSSLRLWFNGVLVCSTTDTQITAAGLSGIRGSANVTWNTFNLIALASDDFDRPNASSLGSNWVQPVGSIEISGNQAMGTGSSPVNDAFYAAGGLLSDTDVSANVSVTASGQFAELVARYSGPGDTNLYEGGIIDSGGTITAVVFRNVGGTWTQLASSAVSTGTGLLEFQVVGSSLRLWFNGVLVCSTTDTQITAAGLSGIRGSANVTWGTFNLRAAYTAPTSDDFDRPNASSLGSNWVQPVGSIEISGNQAMGTGSSPVNDAFYAAGGLLSDTDVSANVSVTASGQFAELVARYSGPGDTNLYEGGIIDSGGTITAVVFRNVGGTWTQLASSAVSTGTGLLEFQVVGSSLRLWFNGVLVCSTTDTQITAAGLSGIRGSANVTWNTFNLRAIY